MVPDRSGVDGRSPVWVDLDLLFVQATECSLVLDCIVTCMRPSCSEQVRSLVVGQPVAFRIAAERGSVGRTDLEDLLGDGPDVAVLTDDQGSLLLLSMDQCRVALDLRPGRRSREADTDGSSMMMNDGSEDHADDGVPVSEEPGDTKPPAGTAVSARTHDEGTVGSDRKFFADAEPGSLKDQTDLIDEDGDDIRMYTGEPVETDDGWILPQQMNVPGNSAGGGEFPDPATPSTQPRDREPEK